MPLADGTALVQGIMVGRYPAFHSISESNSQEALTAAADKARRQFGLSVRVPDGGGQLTGYFSYRARSVALTAGPYGAIIRVVQGGGFLNAANQAHSIDYGDWIYIPPGVVYQFEGAIISGPNLQLIYADFARA